MNLELREVLRAVGLRGLGERGLFGMEKATGDLREWLAFVVALAMLRESLGLPMRVAYIIGYRRMRIEGENEWMNKL